MKKADNIIPGFISPGEKDSRKFWLFAFAIYALVEAVYTAINYLTTKSICSFCVLPVPYYFTQCICNLVFTALLWYCLNLFYLQRLSLLISGNILLFAAYYFLWLCLLHLILNSGITRLVGEAARPQTFRNLVYTSWFDIGKYVLKLSAFYVLKFYFEYRKAEDQRIALAVINKDMQLNLLKQQLSPHFYFNTLNNLYGLARSNSSKLTDALSQLSNIMRYVIVDCTQPKVRLRQELEFLQSYIALEKLRYEANTVIEMKVEGEAADESILPLLLIQFVENAFKHGMKEKSEKNWMKVHIKLLENELLFQVDNSHYHTGSFEGIGISSAEHILRLQYEGKYKLNILNEDNRFSVTLKLNLS